MQKVHKRRWCRGVRLYCRSPAREPGAAMRPTIEPSSSETTSTRANAHSTVHIAGGATRLFARAAPESESGAKAGAPSGRAPKRLMVLSSTGTLGPMGQRCLTFAITGIIQSSSHV